MKPLEQEAQEIFDTHPKLKKVYITSDGIGYEREHDANQHAKTLNDTTVTKFERLVQEPSNKDKNPSDKGENPSDKEQGNDELNEGDVNKEPSNKGQEPSNKDKNKKK